MSLADAHVMGIILGYKKPKTPKKLSKEQRVKRNKKRAALRIKNSLKIM